MSSSPAVTTTSSSSTPSYAIGLNTVPRVATLNPSESTSQENLSTTSANFTKELQVSYAEIIGSLLKLLALC